MARYYFDTHDGGPVLVDEEGQELDGIEAARREALAGLADLARDLVPKAQQHPMGIHVCDEAGRIVFRATLSLQIEDLPPQSA
jgi:hypothetical protein